LGSWNHILTLCNINNNTICNDSGKIHRRAASLLYYETQVTKKRILVYVCGGCCALFIVFLSRNRSIITAFCAAMILTFFCFTAFVYTRIYIVIRKLVRSEKRPACESDGNQNVIKRKMFRESRHARSCFAIVVCFGIFLLPLVLLMVFFKITSIV
jgi:hypothetical protein